MPLTEPARTRLDALRRPVLGRHGWTVLVAVLLVLLVLTAFWPALDNPFVDWDDEANFIENPHYKGVGWSQVRWAWTGVRVGVYQPLAWMLLELQYAVWGLNPFGYHLVSLLLHAVNTVLVYMLVLELTCRGTGRRPNGHSWPELFGAGTAAAVFGVHPLRVEVVAWASCQPYLLCAFFFMSALLVYLRTFDGLAIPRRHGPALVFVLGVAALLSKAVAVSLPFVLLILDVYPLRRYDSSRLASSLARRAMEKIPLVVMSVIFMVVAVHVRDEPALDAQSSGVGAAIARAAFGACFYLVKTVWPAGLSAYYAAPPVIDLWAFPFAPSLVAGVGLTIAALALWRRAPAVGAAWFAYLVIVAPNLVVSTGVSRLAADRYSYVSMIGLVALSGGGLAWLVTHATSRTWRLIVPAASVAVVVAVLIPVTWAQCWTWGSSERLWTHAMRLNGPDVGELRTFVGAALGREGRLVEAREYLEAGVRLAPKSPHAHHQLGTLLAREGRYAEAEASFQEVIRLLPSQTDARLSLGALLARRGELRPAVAQFAFVHRVDPSLGAAARLEAMLHGDRPLGEPLAGLVRAVVAAPRDATAAQRLYEAVTSPR